MSHFRLLRLFSMAALVSASVSLAGQAFAQTTLGGSRHDGPGRVATSSSSFSLGVSRDSGATFVSTATVAETVLIRGEVRPEAANVGQPATLFVVDRLLDSNMNHISFMMRTQSGVWVTWNGSVATLQAFRENQTLTSVVSLDLFTGTLGTAGNHRFFLGYMPPDGILRYHVNGLPITITAAQSKTDQAKALFASKISPNIVLATCISCHIAGGSAGHVHTFLPGSSTSQLDANYNVFVGLMGRGKTFVLGKVSGAIQHDGGGIFPTNTQQYKDLSQFLTLLEP